MNKLKYLSKIEKKTVLELKEKIFEKYPDT